MLTAAAAAAALLLSPFVISLSCLHQSLYLGAYEPGGKGVLEKRALRREGEKKIKRGMRRENADEDTDIK